MESKLGIRVLDTGQAVREVRNAGKTARRGIGKTVGALVQSFRAKRSLSQKNTRR